MIKPSLIALAFADLHLHNWKSNDNYKGNRLNDSIQPLKEIESMAHQKGVPMLLAGDLFHKGKSLNNEVINKFSDYYNTSYLKHGQVKLFTISGNHDQSQKNTYKHRSPSYAKSLHDLTGRISCLDYSFIEQSQFILAGIPYMTHNIGFNKVKKQLEAHLINSKKKKVLIIHRDLPGAKTPIGFEVKESNDLKGKSLEKYFSKWDLVLCGHIHKPQQLGKHIYMLGAPYHQDSGDIGTDMGYWEVYSDMSMKFVKLNLPEYKYLPEGKSLPDDFHIYITEVKNSATFNSGTTHTFNNKMNKVRIASNYLKEKGIKSKAKKRTLIKSLK